MLAVSTSDSSLPTRWPTVGPVIRKVWIETDHFDLEAVAAHLKSGDTTIVREGGDGYYLTSPEIDSAPDNHQANEIAAKIISRINALGRIHDANFRPVKLSGYTDHTGKSVVTGTIGATMQPARARFTGSVTYADGTTPPSPPSPWADYLAVATTNDHVARTLEIMGRAEPLGWVDLYKVHEIVRRAIEPKKLDKIGWTTEAQDRAFTASADRYDVSGDAARHAVDKHAESPKQTMTINEGRCYINELVTKWLTALAGNP
jgi:hypothetical protein